MEVATWIQQSVNKLDRDIVKNSFNVCGILGHGATRDVNNLHCRLRAQLSSLGVPEAEENEDSFDETILDDADEGKI